MKIFIALAVLVFSLVASAGSEEHAQSQTCYYVIAEQSSPINNEIPTQICLETLNIDTNAETISAFSFFYPELYEELKLSYVTRKNEDFFNFSASSLLRDDVVGENTQKMTLFISGQVDNYGAAADIKSLTISLEQIVGKTWVEYPYTKNTYRYKTY